MNSVSILICTYNRADLLARTLHSLNKTNRPRDWTVSLLVVANACTDGTHDLLENYRQHKNIDGHSIPLEWIIEPTPGKSYALNSASSKLTSDVVALVDDDHRVDSNFLINICKAAYRYPDTNLFCGRILPMFSIDIPNPVRVSAQKCSHLISVLLGGSDRFFP